MYLFTNLLGHPAKWDPSEILVPWPGIEPALPALEVRRLNHWIAREVLPLPLLNSRRPVQMGEGGSEPAAHTGPPHPLAGCSHLRNPSLWFWAENNRPA